MPVEESADLGTRFVAFEAWIAAQKQYITIGDLSWETGWSDIRRIATNYVLRRQLEALDATAALAAAGLGHLTVGFIRPALDELLWMLWVKDLQQIEAQELLTAMGRSDGIRSLMAQRAYVGDNVMQELWYPVTFLDAQEQLHISVKDELKKLSKHLNWSGSPLPNARWIAEQSGHKDLYDYLHAATSRVLHFSMGEVLRNSWGHPGGDLTTLNSEFRDYRTGFALHQLPVLFLETLSACDAFLSDAGIAESRDESVHKQVDAAVGALAKLGPVPLVHAHEWNLGPDGRLSLPRST